MTRAPVSVWAGAPVMFTMFMLTSRSERSQVTVVTVQGSGPSVFYCESVVKYIQVIINEGKVFGAQKAINIINNNQNQYTL